MFVIVLFYAGSQPAHSQDYKIDTARIREVVKKWNNAHNPNSEDDFNKLYAPTVLFYANYLDRKVCIEKKRSLLLHEKYHQQILSDLQLAFYESGTIYCGFTKEVATGRSKEIYPSYLLLKKFDEGYLITGESDLVTDRNMKFRPELGVQLQISELSVRAETEEPIMHRQSNYLSLAWVVMPLLAVGLVIIFYFRKHHGSRVEGEFQSGPEEEPRNVELEKGHTFEKFVVGMFKQKSDLFVWTDATSDKGSRDYHPMSNYNPDLQYEYRMEGKRYPLAVECKYRSKYSGSIKIVTDGQLERYKKFQTIKGMNVFIVLGLGGSPKKPAELFVIPIEEVKVWMDREALRKYKTSGAFNYDTNTRRLY